MGIQHDYPLSHSVPTVLRNKDLTCPPEPFIQTVPRLDFAAQELPVCRLCATTRRSRRAAFGTGRIDDIAANIGRREPTDAPGSAVTDYHLCSGGRWQMTFALAIDR